MRKYFRSLSLAACSVSLFVLAGPVHGGWFCSESSSICFFLLSFKILLVIRSMFGALTSPICRFVSGRCLRQGTRGQGAPPAGADYRASANREGPVACDATPPFASGGPTAKADSRPEQRWSLTRERWRWNSAYAFCAADFWSYLRLRMLARRGWVLLRLERVAWAALQPAFSCHPKVARVSISPRAGRHRSRQLDDHADQLTNSADQLT